MSESELTVAGEVALLASELRARMEVMEETEHVASLLKTSEKKISAPAPRAGSTTSPAAPSAPAERPADASGSDRAARLAELAKTVSACRKCPLGSQRLNAVFGVGSPEAGVLFVGEGPGFQEDHQGEPFIGRAGQLLDKILESIGLSRKQVYIANIVKCHPMVNPSNPEARGNDRPPTPEEIAACREYLDRQIDIIAPKVIVTLGSVATKVLLGEDVPITKVRGHWREYRPAASGSRESEGKPIKLLPTFHPAALLRNPVLKRDVWIDMKNLKKELES